MKAPKILKSLHQIAAPILLALVCSNQALAADVVIHGWSHHFHERQHPDGRPWQESNPGLGIRFKTSEDTAIQAGVYRNSLDKTSLYAIADYTPGNLDRLRLADSQASEPTTSLHFCQPPAAL